MRRISVLLVALLVISAMVAAVYFSRIVYQPTEPLRADEKTDSELAKLAGEFTLVSMEENGTPGPEHRLKELQQMQYVFKGNRLKFMTWHLSDLRSEQVTISDHAVVLDVTKTPKQIDFTEEESAETKDGKSKEKSKQSTTLAIYEFDGTTLKLCVSRTGTSHPTEFDTTGQPDSILYIMKKSK